MYANLGSKHNQDVIRDLNKTGPHCKHLMRNPNACNDMWIGNGQKGICSLNPYHPVNVAKRETMIEQMPSIVSEETANRFQAIGELAEARIDMGLVNSLSDLTPAEFLLGWHYRRRRQVEDLKIQAQFVISEYAQALERGKKNR